MFLSKISLYKFSSHFKDYYHIFYVLIFHFYFNVIYTFILPVSNYLSFFTVSYDMFLPSLQVHLHLKSCLRKRWPSSFKDDTAKFQSTASGTQYTNVSSGRRGTHQNEHNYIPLNTIPDDNIKPNGHTVNNSQCNNDLVG